MKISYLVTCKNEIETLEPLLERLIKHIKANSDELVIIDDFSDNLRTQRILDEAKKNNGVKLFRHALADDYGEHKNWGNQQCSGDWICQIDGDEMPSVTLLETLKEIIDMNTGVEMFLVPRVNNFKGLKHEHAPTWGWQITDMPPHGLVVNWPDWQTRIYKRDDRIQWKNRLHERINGFSQFGFLPSDPEYAIFHNKTIEKQIETNLRYNRDFSQAENGGVSNKRS